ncbi:ureidoglycolate lyase, partial [Escherichia coli]
MKLQVLPLSQEAFSAYGDVIETQQRDFFHINNGLVERYHDLALVEILEQDRTLISINRAQPANLPLTIYELERHPLGTQAFIPMKGEVFVV